MTIQRAWPRILVAALALPAPLSLDSAAAAVDRPSVPACVLQPPVGYIAPPPYLPPPIGNVCSADHASALRDCVALVRMGTRDAINVTSLIECSGAGDCLVDLSDIARPVTVYGTYGAGFRRRDSYTYPIIDVSRSSGITISNLIFDEDASTQCDACVSTIRVFDTANITIDRVSIRHAKRMGVEFGGSTNLTIRNSAIEDAGVFGIWSGSVLSTGVLIENNSFRDVRSNAMFLSYADAGEIRQNTFTHNHRLAIFSEPGCGGPCPGGQLYLSLTSNTHIEGNLIRDGFVEVPNISGQAWGIEMDPGLHDIVIANNELANNKGAGIGANPAATDAQQVLVTSNKLYGNGVGNSFPFWGFAGKPGIQVTANCTAPVGPFTDDPLETAVAAIRNLHIIELRVRIDALRLRFGRPTAFPWTDAWLPAYTSEVRAQHVLDLRAALSEAYAAALLPPPTFAEPLTAGVTVKAAQIAELRSLVRTIE